MDFRLARLLATEVVTEKPFADISDAAYSRAERLVRDCGRVIFVKYETGQCNSRINDLVRLADELGKLETI